MTENETPDTPDTPENTEPKNDFDLLQDLVDKVKKDGPLGLGGNKQAARRTRNALNDIKKMCTPLRGKIQEAVSKK